jgi:hypothetical protein
MTRQWIRVITGKPGRSSVGYIERTWNKHGIILTLIRFAYDFPFDLVAKSAHTFELLTEAECAALELTWPAPSNPVPTG